MRSLRSRHRDGLIAATVRVLTRDAGGRELSAGTGFFVAPGYVVTCAHVVPEVPGCTYSVAYEGVTHPATVVVREPKEGADRLYSYPDVALLTVAFERHPCVPLGLEPPEPGRELYAYGCPLLGADEPFWEHMDLVSEGTRVRAENRETFLKTRDGQVQPGASGSGVVDVGTGLLVGVLVQTRDATLDLGGVAVPSSVIVDTLAQRGHDVAEANRQATAEAGTLAGARQRLGWALQNLAAELEHARPMHWRSMLMALDGAPPDRLQVEDVALALLNLDLDDLGDALRELARACHSAQVARRLLDGAAPFAWIANRPWVEPETARQLATERKIDRPRAVHLPGCPRSVRMNAGRAAVDGVWTVLMPAPSGADPGGPAGLPAWLMRAIQVALLEALGVFVDPDEPGELERHWASRGRKAKERYGRNLLIVLPAGVADTAAVEALRAEFAPCLFVLADRTLSPSMLASADVLALRASLPADDESEADLRYGEITVQIDRAAG